MKKSRSKDLLQMSGVFFRINSLTFGGGNATTNALHREIVAKRGWLTESQYQFCYALARLSPGANHLAFCIGAGWKMFGRAGALLALLVSSLPGAIIIVILTYLYDSWATNKIVLLIIQGIIAATMGIMVSAVWTLIRPFMNRASWLRVLVIGGGSFLAAGLFHLHPLYVIGAAALIGIFWKERQEEPKTD